MKTFHILNGDCLAEQLSFTKINHGLIVFRECLIEGNLSAENTSDFWTVRQKFITQTYIVSTNVYVFKTVKEIEKIYKLPDNSEVCLWFENDLFCQVNMWFVISILANNTTIKLFRVFPIIENNADIWKGFRGSNSEKLEQAFDLKIQFTKKEIELGRKLWLSFQKDNINRLKKLSKKESKCFKFLEEVCKAHIERFPIDGTLGRPDKVIKELIENYSTEFQTVLIEFSEREGVYGFGDMQIKKIYDKQIQNL